MADRNKLSVNRVRVMRSAFVRALQLGGEPRAGQPGSDITEPLTGLADNADAVNALITRLAGVANDVEITVGTETDDEITVTLQALDVNGDPLAARTALKMFFADDDAGDTETDAPPEYGVSVTGDALVLEDGTTGTSFTIVTDATGAAEMVLRDSGAKTLYLVVATPLGPLVVSDAITWS